jgi:hypothetical protein
MESYFNLPKNNSIELFIPDYYRGTYIDPSTSPRDETVQFLKNKSDWNGFLKSDWTRVKEYATNLGCKVCSDQLAVESLQFYYYLGDQSRKIWGMLERSYRRDCSFKKIIINLSEIW